MVSLSLGWDSLSSSFQSRKDISVHLHSVYQVIYVSKLHCTQIYSYSFFLGKVESGWAYTFSESSKKGLSDLGNSGGQREPKAWYCVLGFQFFHFRNSYLLFSLLLSRVRHRQTNEEFPPHHNSSRLTIRCLPSHTSLSYFLFFPLFPASPISCLWSRSCSLLH